MASNSFFASDITSGKSVKFSITLSKISRLKTIFQP
jgi:hypothetical protein